MDLPLLSACFAALALTFYVMLDGFDLGVGILLLIQPLKESRDHMIDSITPTWDGNETWLVMTGITLFTAFPIAYGILMPAFYLPIIIMLLSLGIRGVSFEFRIQMKQYRRQWDLAFGVGSFIAAFMQGIILGALIQGVRIENMQFAGSVMDAFRPFPLLSGATLVIGYCVLGAGWLLFKGNTVIQRSAVDSLRTVAPAFAILFFAGCYYAAIVQPAVLSAWGMHSGLMLVIFSLVILTAFAIVHARTIATASLPFLFGLLMFLFGIAGFATIVFPNIIPFKLTLWQAASNSSSQKFMLIGAALVTPVILAYSAFAYWVFRGRTPENGWLE